MRTTRALLVATLLGLSRVGFTQELYLKGGASYSFNFPSTSAASVSSSGVSTTFGPQGTIVSQNRLTGSYGSGLNLHAALGYTFNKYVGVEFGLDYLPGNARIVGKTVNGVGSVETTSRLRGGLVIAPGLVLTTGSDKRVAPYVRFGILVPVSVTLVNNVAYDRLPSSQRVFVPNAGSSVVPANVNGIQIVEISTNVTVGFFGALGLTAKLTDQLSLFGEVISTSLTAPFNESRITLNDVVTISTVGTQDYTTTQPTAVNLTEFQRRTIFRDNLTSTSNNGQIAFTNRRQVQTDQPNESLREFAVLSAVGLRVGIKLGFGQSNPVVRPLR